MLLLSPVLLRLVASPAGHDRNNTSKTGLNMPHLDDITYHDAINT